MREKDVLARRDSPTAVYLLRIWYIIIAVIIIATMWTKHVAEKKISS